MMTIRVPSPGVDWLTVSRELDTCFISGKDPDELREESMLKFRLLLRAVAACHESGRPASVRLAWMWIKRQFPKSVYRHTEGLSEHTAIHRVPALIAGMENPPAMADWIPLSRRYPDDPSKRPFPRIPKFRWIWDAEESKVPAPEDSKEWPPRAQYRLSIEGTPCILVLDDGGPELDPNTPPEEYCLSAGGWTIWVTRPDGSLRRIWAYGQYLRDAWATAWRLHLRMTAAGFNLARLPEYSDRKEEVNAVTLDVLEAAMRNHRKAENATRIRRRRRLRSGT